MRQLPPATSVRANYCSATSRAPSVAPYEQFEHAGQSGDNRRKISSRAFHGAALHAAGRPGRGTSAVLGCGAATDGKLNRITRCSIRCGDTNTATCCSTAVSRAAVRDRATQTPRWARRVLLAGHNCAGRSLPRARRVGTGTERPGRGRIRPARLGRPAAPASISIVPPLACALQRARSSAACCSPAPDVPRAR